MPIKYTEAELVQRVNEYIQLYSDLSEFYRQDFVNYGGKVKGGAQYYTEIIARVLLDNIGALENIPTITRNASYKVETHTGHGGEEYSNRVEERMAKDMFDQRKMPGIGRVLDYQVPLKNVQTDKAGKIDLIAYDQGVLRLLELKVPGSAETMLRCVLEGFTYLRTVDTVKLLKDFDLPPDTQVRACPFVSVSGKQASEMEEDRPWLRRLMERLGVEPLYYQGAVSSENRNRKTFIVVSPSPGSA